MKGLWYNFQTKYKHAQLPVFGGSAKIGSRHVTPTIVHSRIEGPAISPKMYHTCRYTTEARTKFVPLVLCSDCSQFIVSSLRFCFKVCLLGADAHTRQTCGVVGSVCFLCVECVSRRHTTLFLLYCCLNSPFPSAKSVYPRHIFFDNSYNHLKLISFTNSTKATRKRAPRRISIIQLEECE